MKPSFTRPLRNRYLFAGDLVLLTAAAYFSYVLRLETLDLGAHWPGFLLFTALALVILPLVFGRTGIYARYWRYASVKELLLLAGSVTVGVLLTGSLSLLAVQLLPGAWPLPRSIPLPKHRGILSSSCCWRWSSRPARVSPCVYRRAHSRSSDPTARKAVHDHSRCSSWARATPAPCLP